MVALSCKQQQTTTKLKNTAFQGTQYTTFHFVEKVVTAFFFLGIQVLANAVSALLLFTIPQHTHTHTNTVNQT